ncbi:MULTISPECIES: DUF1507 family protein [Aerococcus]|uniref:DUF1507 family protein n=1 Tax=Aerococcus sanguinicola TaxID=119206 RepID=A0A5N1GJ92_9LACT|nr:MULTISPECIES: DUF1507 family protein [Aerococcus]KAA9300454.1 DUF1507 family protein [Aerococcus sanguinicola]MDK6369733.1 DUF1507 family protein [Aerococcus sp. UMB9870]MDK6680373.1 DUF1507 family protein [Aerococcus sp. UMB8608]MDK6686952.1 DUF1507 family protein [Aerococcus sp. UMB8623]MDK6940064.1 DUF1507 family protein [Aerococcus sp. UMB8487]
MDINQKQAEEILLHEAQRISHLILSQKEHLCFAQCPAFEEIVDTQMYGFSKQVAYAIAIGAISKNKGHQIIRELEDTLNQVYTEIFEEGQFYHVEGDHRVNRKDS